MRINKRESKPIFVLLFLSMVLHIVALLAIWLNMRDSQSLEISDRYTQLVQLRYKNKEQVKPLEEVVVEPELPKEEPEPIPEENLIDHEIKEYNLNDKRSSSNQDITKTEVLDYGSKQEIVKESVASDLVGKRDVLSSTGLSDFKSQAEGLTNKLDIGSELTTLNSIGESELGAESDIEFIPPEELEIPPELLGNLGNMELLEDQDLGNTYIEDPFSEEESAELKLVNRYLERMTKQVMSFWVNPYKGTKQYKGVIKLSLNLQGELVNAYVFRSSGHRLLDISVLDAIRAVRRYEVPENEIITARYYTNLSFHYSSIEEETELMPFEEGYTQVN